MRISQIDIGLDAPDLHSHIQLALANVPIDEENFKASYRGRPVLKQERLQEMSGLLNSIAEYRTPNGKKIDLVIFPEVSIPHAWQALHIVPWVRRRHIGVICGLEHRINRQGEALNEVLAVLPYKTKSGQWACAPIRRLKRIYSPGEELLLVNNGLAVPRPRDPYQLFHWRGVSFAIYNCCELTSIEDRALFKSKVDFIIATECNHDVNYFSNIVEAAARDLHCYVIQVNDSKYGDSRIVVPAKTESMNPLRIKGGDNLTFLTTSLNLKALREHQRIGYGLQKESKAFKPTPPGLKLGEVMKRISFGER